jgi:hypothetical protein
VYNLTIHIIYSVQSIGFMFLTYSIDFGSNMDFPLVHTELISIYRFIINSHFDGLHLNIWPRNTTMNDWIDIIYMFVMHIHCNWISMFLTDLIDDIGHSLWPRNKINMLVKFILFIILILSILFIILILSILFILLI